MFEWVYAGGALLQLYESQMNLVSDEPSTKSSRFLQCSVTVDLNHTNVFYLLDKGLTWPI